MSKLLGLDVSTSFVGVAVLDMATGLEVKLDHIDLRKGQSLFEKGAWVEDYLSDLRNAHPDIAEVYIEDAAKKFASGRSSASVIATLMRFNGICSYIAYTVFSFAPKYVAPSAARKLCGLKMQQSKKCGKTHKQQTFDAIMGSDLSHITWPTKRAPSVNIVDYAYDTVDAYVVAKAGRIIEQNPPPV
jgi:hypothetical protein